MNRGVKYNLHSSRELRRSVSYGLFEVSASLSPRVLVHSVVLLVVIHVVIVSQIFVVSERGILQIFSERRVPSIELSDTVTEAETFLSCHEGSVSGNGTLSIAVLGVHLSKVGHVLDLVVVNILHAQGVAVNSL
jgi:hypothetical protein